MILMGPFQLGIIYDSIPAFGFSENSGPENNRSFFWVVFFFLNRVTSFPFEDLQGCPNKSYKGRKQYLRHRLLCSRQQTIGMILSLQTTIIYVM